MGEHLVRQLKDFSNQFALKHTTFLTSTSLHMIGPRDIVIFDEYYHALWKSLLTIEKGVIQGIHRLQTVGKQRILLGGTAGLVFKEKILPKLFDKKPLVIDEFKSVFDMLG